MRRFRLCTASATHPGLVRAANEDSLLVREADGVWLVADGMGGHANGQWASATVVQSIGGAPISGEFDDDVAQLAAALQAANNRVYELGAVNGVSMGSTAVLLHISGERFACIWAGDSRIYLLRERTLHRMTRDHTQVQDMVDRGLLTPGEASRHPMSHILSRAVGAQASVELDAVYGVAAARDIFLLCSDGLSGVVSDAEIAERLSDGAGERACQRLLDLALSRGAPDNVTLIAVACEETTALSLAPAGQM